MKNFKYKNNSLTNPSYPDSTIINLWPILIYLYPVKVFLYMFENIYNKMLKHGEYNKHICTYYLTYAAP